MALSGGKRSRRSLLERPQPLRPRPRAGSTRRGPLKALGRLDQALLVAMRTRGHTAAGERVAGALGTFGEWGLGWVALATVGAGLNRRRRPAWWSAAAAGPAAVAVNYAAKLAVGRERPLIEDHPPLARAPSKLSFPSAHATSSMTAATAMSRIAPGAGRPLLLGLAAAVCASRPFLGMHYPSDVLAGAALGVMLGRAWPLPDLKPHEHWAR